MSEARPDCEKQGELLAPQRRQCQLPASDAVPDRQLTTLLPSKPAQPSTSAGEWLTNSHAEKLSFTTSPPSRPVPNPEELLPGGQVPPAGGRPFSGLLAESRHGQRPFQGTTEVKMHRNWI